HSVSVTTSVRPALFTLALPDALPISGDAWGPAARPRGYGPLPPPLPSRYLRGSGPGQRAVASGSVVLSRGCYVDRETAGLGGERSEEHTSELQSRENLVCRLLLEKKK